MINLHRVLDELGKLLKENPGTHLTISFGVEKFIIAWRGDGEELEFMDGDTIAEAMNNLLDEP